MALFNKDDSMAKQANAAVSGQINMIGEGTVFEGTLRTESDIRISGRIVGKLFVTGKASVAQEGGIDGEFHAGNADVAGTIEGDVKVKERLVLKSSARVNGNVEAGRLIVEEGAVFNGNCLMGEGREKVQVAANGAAGKAAADKPAADKADKPKAG